MKPVQNLVKYAQSKYVQLVKYAYGESFLKSINKAFEKLDEINSRIELILPTNES